MTPTKQPVAAGNWRRGRAWDGGPDLLVIHVTEGSKASARSWFANPAAQVSAHYCVNRDGTIDQYVGENDTAYHAGRVLRPSAALVLERQGVNPNAYSIGIEHEGTGTDDLTPPQREASLALVRDICERRRIPMTRRHIVGHREVYAAKTCPGVIDVDALVRALDRRKAPPAHQPLVVWSDYFRDWLLVTRVVSDREWYFVPMGEVDEQPRRSTESLMKMPRKMV